MMTKNSKQLLDNTKTRYYKLLSLVIILVLAVTPILSNYEKVYAKTKYDGILLDKELLVMKVNDTFKFNPGKYQIIKDSKVSKLVDDVKPSSWSSSDNNVATIDKNGVVTAKSSGNCTITATWGKYKAKSKIAVRTKEELYNQVLDGEMTNTIMTMALITNNTNLIYDRVIDDDLAKVEIKAVKNAKKIIDTVITDSMSDYEKMMVLASWITENIKIVDNYTSDYRLDLAYESDLGYTYIDALLYGKSDVWGLAALYSLLLNACGIRSELLLTYPTNYNPNGTNLRGCNVVQLEGDWYIFDLISLANSYNYYMNEENRHLSIYELLGSGHTTYDTFINTTTNQATDEKNKVNTSRTTDYNPVFWTYQYETLLFADKTSYDCYYYDFYTKSILYSTIEDTKKGKYFLEPFLTSYPEYPDSTSSKYKKIMENEFAIINTVVEATSSVDEMCNFHTLSSTSDSTKLINAKEKLSQAETQFETVKDNIIDKKAIEFMQGKLTDAKEKLAKID